MTEIPVLNHIQKHRSASIRLAQLASEVPNHVITASPAPIDPFKYEKASNVLFGVITRDFPEERFKSGGVIRGFNVSFWLAAWGMRAYREYVKKEGSIANPQKLGEILLESYDPAVTTFSSTTNNKNKVLERAFGLNAHLSPAYEPVPFRITASNRGEILSPSELTLHTAMLELEYDISDEISSVGRCAASGKMLREVWKATINTCVNSDALFPYDLALDS